jgi:hypothetical protein
MVFPKRRYGITKGKYCGAGRHLEGIISMVHGK